VKNQTTFESRFIMVTETMSSIVGSLWLVNKLDIGGMHKKQSELLILRTFWLGCHLPSSCD